MASRRMRIKAVAKVPTIGKPRVVDRGDSGPVNFSEPSSPLRPCRSPAPHNTNSNDYERVTSPRPQGMTSPRPQRLNSPVNFNFPCPSPERGTREDDGPSRFFSLPSPGGLIAPKSPSNYIRRSPSPAAPSPGPVIVRNPESPRRPTTPHTPGFSLQVDTNSQDPMRSPVYSPSYASVMSPGYGPGIQRLAPPPSPSGLYGKDSSNHSSSSVTSSSSSRTHNNNNNNAQQRGHGSGKGKSSKLTPLHSPQPSYKSFKDPGTSIISQVLNNSDTLRQRLQSGSAAPSTSKYAMIRKDYLAKYQNNLPNPKELTMLHYAFFNPPKPGGELTGDKRETGEKGAAPAKRRRRTDSRDSVVSVASTASVKSVAPETDPIAEEPEPEADSSTASQAVGPRVKVGPDGQLIIDEQSLVIETSEAQRAKKQLESMETVSGSSFIVGSSGLYSRKKSLNRGLDWDEKETMKFYKALITCGTDFSMMTTVFKGTRNRGELKAKFKREDRRNPQQVSKALAKQCFDPTLALTDSEEELEAAILESQDKSPDDIGDIENIHSSPSSGTAKDSSSSSSKNEVSKKKYEFRKSVTAVKKRGKLASAEAPKPQSLPFRRPSGQMDWRLYAVMKNNSSDSPSTETTNTTSNVIPELPQDSLEIPQEVITVEISSSPTDPPPSSSSSLSACPTYFYANDLAHTSSSELCGGSLITASTEILLSDH